MTWLKKVRDSSCHIYLSFSASIPIPIPKPKTILIISVFSHCCLNILRPFSRMARLCVVAARICAFYAVGTIAYVTPRNLIPTLRGCQKLLPNGQTAGVVSNVTITSGGHQRNYLISIPPTYNSLHPTPIILSYHGGVRTAEDQLLLDQLTYPEFNKKILYSLPSRY